MFTYTNSLCTIYTYILYLLGNNMYIICRHNDECIIITRLIVAKNAFYIFVLIFFFIKIFLAQDSNFVGQFSHTLILIRKVAAYH